MSGEAAAKRFLVLEITEGGGAWLVARRATEGEAEMLAEALTRGMRSMGDEREYRVKEQA